MRLLGKWQVLAGLVVGTVALIAAFCADWFVVHQSYTRAYWAPREPMELADWSSLVIAVLAVAIAFAMLVGARNQLVPRIPSLALAIAGAVGLVGFVWAMLGEQSQVELYNKHGEPYFSKVPVRFNAWPYVAAAALVLVTLCAARLWWIGRALARSSAQARDAA